MNIEPDVFSAFFNAIHYIAYQVSKAFTAPFQRDSYLYWPFITSTIAIALVAIHHSSRKFPETPASHWRDLFGCGLWWHPSARADYRIYFANALLLPLILSPLLFADEQFVAWADALLGRNDSLTSGAADAGPLSRLVFTLAFFVAYDFGRFVAHSLLHDIPFLWEFHKVHHSAEVLTPMTAFRVHPVDLLVMVWVPALLTGLMTWIFNLMSPSAVPLYTFLGLHVLIWAFNLIDNLRHSPVWLTYGPMLGKWLISPAHHQLHHSIEPRHLGCNRGFDIALWDRLYGTLYVPSEAPERFRMGLGDGTEEHWNKLLTMYFRPFAENLRRLVGALRRNRTT